MYNLRDKFKVEYNITHPHALYLPIDAATAFHQEIARPVGTIGYCVTRPFVQSCARRRPSMSECRPLAVECKMLKDQFVGEIN